MKSLLKEIIIPLIDDPSQIDIKERDGLNGMRVYEISVAKDDMGKIIGRRGKIARAIRTVVKAKANKDNVKVSVDIV